MDDRLVSCANPVSKLLRKRESLIAIFSIFLFFVYSLLLQWFVIFHKAISEKLIKLDFISKLAF